MNATINANSSSFDPIDQLLFDIIMGNTDSGMDASNAIDLVNMDFDLLQMSFEQPWAQLGNMTPVTSDLVMTNLVDQVQPAEVLGERRPFRFTGEPRRPRQPVTPDEHKEIIRLHFEENKSIREIESISNIPSSTVGRHIKDEKDGRRRE